MKKAKFLNEFNFYKLFWIFFIGCFLGVVVETIWWLITHQVLESRKGLIYGPFNLIYGIGALLLTLSLNWAKGKNNLTVFFGGAILGSSFEYFCSWFQEIVFGTMSWHYYHLPFNIKGRINLLFTIFWGILAILWIQLIYPYISLFIKKLPHYIFMPLTKGLCIFMLINTIISGLAVMRMTERHMGIPASSIVERFLDTYYNDNLLLKVYPHMEFIKK